MFCANCGKMMGDHDLFCAECGTPVAPKAAAPAAEPPVVEPAAPVVEQPPVEEPVWSAPTAPLETPVWSRAADLDPAPAEEPAQPSMDPPAWASAEKPAQSSLDAPEWPPEIKPVKQKKKKKNPLRIILPAVAGIAVLAVLAVVVLGFIGGPAAKVGMAFTNTAKEYAKVSEKLGIAAPEATTEMKPFSEVVEIEINDFPQLPEIEGIGARVEMGLSLEEKELGIAVTPMYGSMDILNAQVLLKDDELYASVPQLTDGRSYMVNTETIGESLVEFGANPEAVDLSINVFDLIEIAQKYAKPDEKTQKKIEKAVTDLIKEIEVEKDGTDTLEINDHDIKCTMYDVVIPDKALIDYFETIAEVMSDTDPVELFTEMMEEIGLPAYLIDEAIMEMGDVDMSESMESLYMAIEEFGDIELQVGVHKGLVAYIGWEVSVMDTNMELSVELGGGKEYVNDLRIVMEVEDGGKIVVASSGDHACSDGEFTDETTVSVITDYEEITFTSEMTYEPKAKKDNFQWTLGTPDEEVIFSGHVTLGKDEAVVDLDSVEFWSYGQQLMDIRLYVEVGAYDSLDMDTGDAVDILAMSEDELYDELMILEESAMAWAEELANSNPDLVALLESLMYY